MGEPSSEVPNIANTEHAININFINYDRGLSADVAVELIAECARELIRTPGGSPLARGSAEHLITGTTTATGCQLAKIEHL